jgi:hypothetical protein
LAELRPDWLGRGQICWFEVRLAKLRPDQLDLGERGEYGGTDIWNEFPYTG